jgi:hypothetical protein
MSIDFYKEFGTLAVIVFLLLKIEKQVKEIKSLLDPKSSD